MWILIALLGVAALALGRALAAEDTLTGAMALHATLMIAAWGALIPLGGIVARYFKVTPNQDYPAVVDNPFWWNWHRILQYAGVGLATVAFAVILTETGGRFDTWHGRCGLLVMAVAWVQVLSPLVRGSKGGPTDARADPGDPATWRGDHFDMTRRRRLFEAWHKTAGWSLIAFAQLTILLGIALVGGLPWLMLVAGAMQGALVCAILDGRLRRRWVDTSAALWGPDPACGRGRRHTTSERSLRGSRISASLRRRAGS